MIDTTEGIGLLAGSLTTLAFLPQVLQVWRTRSARDISLGMYLIFCTGVALWLVYGILIDSTPILIANCLTLVLATSILVMKVVWECGRGNPKPPVRGDADPLKLVPEGGHRDGSSC